MDITISRGLNETYLVLPAGEVNAVAYRILSENPAKHLMRPELISETECAFAVSGGSILRNKYGRGGMSLSVIRKLFFDLEQAVRECESCLMCPDNIILNPQVIIEKDDGGFFFAAHPGRTEDLIKNIRILVRFCSENISADAQERTVMDRLTAKTEEELFAFDDLLFILGDAGARNGEKEKASGKMPGSPKEKDNLLSAFLLLAASAVFLLLYLAFPAPKEARFLLASFVCLVSSAAFTVRRLRSRGNEPHASAGRLV